MSALGSMLKNLKGTVSPSSYDKVTERVIRLEDQMRLQEISMIRMQKTI